MFFHLNPLGIIILYPPSWKLQQIFYWPFLSSPSKCSILLENSSEFNTSWFWLIMYWLLWKFDVTNHRRQLTHQLFSAKPAKPSALENCKPKLKWEMSQQCSSAVADRKTLMTTAVIANASKASLSIKTFWVCWEFWS